MCVAKDHILIERRLHPHAWLNSLPPPQDESFAVVQAWARACTHFSPELMLCVGVEAQGAGTANQALEERARDFSLDHGLEYVPVPHAVDGAAPAASAADSQPDSGESFGSPAEKYGLGTCMP